MSELLRAAPYLAAAAAAAAIAAGTAGGTSVPAAQLTWQAVRIGCHGHAAHRDYATLAAASQAEVDLVATQVTRPGTYREVRLVRIVSRTPEITALVSRHDTTCRHAAPVVSGGAR